MQHWELPALYCPFPSFINRYADQVGQSSIEWAARHGLLEETTLRQRLERLGVGWLVGRTNPHTAREPLQLLADWCTWLFLQDDRCDESGLGKSPEALAEIYGRAYEILAGSPLHDADSPMMFALADLRVRFKSRASQEWMPRFLRAVVNTFQASVWEAGNRARSVMPDLNGYFHYRPYTGGVYTLVETLELTEEFGLPTRLYDHPYLQELVRRAVNVVCWCNDIYSVAKEIKQGDVHNLVLVLQARHAISLQEALHRAAALHDAEVRLFMDMEAEIPDFHVYNAAVCGFVAAQKAWMKGNLDWSMLSERYNPMHIAL